MPKIIEDEKIFHAVMQVVSERGYASATTKQMANAAHVSEVTLFRKYANKAQLVKQALASIVEQTDFVAATQYTGDVTADLLRVLQSYQNSAVKQGPLIFILLSEMPRFPELEDLLDIPYRIYTHIGSLLARYQSEGVMQQEPPLHAAAALLGPLMFTAMMRSALPHIDVPLLDLQSHLTRYLDGRRVEK